MPKAERKRTAKIQILFFPEELKKIDEEVKKLKFSTRNNYIRTILAFRQKLIFD